MTDPRALVTRGIDLTDADLRGADLSGLEIRRISLRGARLDHADLSGAWLRQVDLDDASLDGASLRDARLEQVSVARSSAIGLDATNVTWRLVDLTATTLDRAVLGAAALTTCVLDGASLRGADLRDARLTDCSFAGVDLDEADLRGALTSASRFPRARLVGARGFAGCREIIVEILGRHVDGVVERAAVFGAVAIGDEWSYQAWRRWLDEHRYFRELVLRILAEYPASGCGEALHDALPRAAV